MPPVMKTQGLNHWTAWEVPGSLFNNFSPTPCEKRASCQRTRAGQKNSKSLFLVLIFFFNVIVKDILKSFLFYMCVELTYNVVLISGVQQNDSVIHIHVSLLVQVLFPFRLLYNTEQSSLRCTAGPCWSTLNIAV